MRSVGFGVDATADAAENAGASVGDSRTCIRRRICTTKAVPAQERQSQPRKGSPSPGKAVPAQDAHPLLPQRSAARQPIEANHSAPMTRAWVPCKTSRGIGARVWVVPRALPHQGRQLVGICHDAHLAQHHWHPARPHRRQATHAENA
eukprot:350120-Chlamydomonas_euryale.AAC.2